jgi:hypothetical protein
MRTTEEICKYIIDNEKTILSNLKPKAVSDYLFIVQNVYNDNISNNKSFQKTFKSFYGLNTAGLTEEFCERYFNIMENSKTSIVAVEDIVSDLYTIKRKKGDHSIQFSFATKLINTLNCEYPIYDSKVRVLFGLKNLQGQYKDCKTALGNYNAQHNYIKTTIAKIIENNMLHAVIQKFDNMFSFARSISIVKKIDFIFWEAGKLIDKETRRR